MAPKIVDKEARKREILHAAMRIVAQRGINNVKIDDIAKAAGIGKGTVYEYFPSKEAIFGEAIKEYLNQAETAAARKMFRARTPREKIEALLTGWLEITESKSGDFLMLFIDVWAEALRQTNPAIKKIFDFREFYYEYRGMVASIVKEGIERGEFRDVDPDYAAGSILALFDGIMLHWLIDRDKIDVHKLTDLALGIVWKGIGK